MARTVGRRYVALAEALIRRAKSEGIENCDDIIEYIREHIPAEAFDEWEGAYGEIKQMCFDLT
jgi:hypothetical protein